MGRRVPSFDIQNPESEEGPELVSLVVKTVIFACLENPEEQKRAQSRAPDNDEERGNNVACIAAVFAQGKCEDGEYDEIRAACEVGEFVEFEAECNGEEE